jgi:ABC-2 type transport system ATP-binding protein
LDEPTIGLDVIAQRNIQQFLKHYQEERQITILLTSHYMKDVSALCQRVVVIAQGILQYDGSLSGIIDSFSGSKVIQLQLGIEQAASGLERFGEILKTDMPRVSIRVPRANVSRVLAEILNTYTVDDVAVEDPPLEEVIASLFHSIAEAN